jgi:succinate dehydrogenase / fumarate reductase cytochrome b subunit
MSLLRNVFCTTLGRKYIMALTGFGLVVFAIGHLVGNFQIFQHPDHINGYGHFLHSLGPLLWAVRIGLIVLAVLHIWAAVKLTLDNRAARPADYGFKHTIRATLASRTMRMTGVIVLAFLLYHLAHFTTGWAQTDTFKTNFDYVMTQDYKIAGFTVVKAGTVVHDVHTMMVLGFQPLIVSLFYVVAVGLLSFHLLHGAESMFQSVGLRTENWGMFLKRVVQVFCIAYFLGNLAIPGAILAGKVKPHEMNRPPTHASAGAAHTP